MSLSFYVYLAVSTAIFMAAATASRTYAGNDYWPWFAFALVLYGIGNFLMVKLMRESGMSVAFSVSSVAQLILVNVIALVFFGEKLTSYQLLGLALGLVSIVLIVFPLGGRA